MILPAISILVSRNTVVVLAVVFEVSPKSAGLFETAVEVFNVAPLLAASQGFLEAVEAVGAVEAAAVVADGLRDPELEAVEEFELDF